jgi:hypothetical protein
VTDPDIHHEYSRIDLDAFLGHLGVAGHAVEDLARTWVSPPTLHRVGQAFDAAGVDLDDYQAITAWVALDQAVAEYVERRGFGDAILPDLCDMHVEHADLGPGLHVPDEELRARLPLVELAEDLARQRGGRLVVGNAAPGGLWGCYSFTPHRGVVVLLDATLGDTDLAETFGHELGHGLDPGRALVTLLGAEVFADALGPMLLDAKPTTVAAADPLVADALEATAGLRHPLYLSVARLLEDVLVEVGATPWLEPELLAARGGPGVKRGPEA